MTIETLFSHQDLHKAKAEINCVYTCNEMLKESLTLNDLESARIASEDIVRSLKELERLRHKKLENDRLTAFVEELKMKNINVEKLKRWGLV